MGMLTQTQSMTDAVGDITSQVGDQMAGFDDQTSMITGATLFFEFSLCCPEPVLVK
eukprot:COSAG06_NODE_1156_length_10478_cov_5.792177_9_plen_56_part_00